MSDKAFNRRDPIVPEREERIGRQGGGPARRDANPRSSRRESGSTGGFWKFLLVVLMLALGAVAFIAFQQYQQLNTLQASFDNLQGKLDSTDESLSQSGAALGIKLKKQEEELAKHWSEIKKLWGVSNDRNRKAIAANSEALKGVKGSTATRKKAVAALESKVDKKVNELNRSIEAATSATLATKLEIEESQDQALDLVDRLNRLDQSLKQWQQEMNRRMVGNEEAINAIDAYRRSTNQQILQIKQQLAAPAGQ